MSTLAAIRNYRTTRSRRVLAVVLFGWLNVLLFQPCAMAASQHDQPDAELVAAQLSHASHAAVSHDRHVHCDGGECCDGIIDACCVGDNTAQLKHEPKSAEFVENLSLYRAEWFEGTVLVNAAPPAFPADAHLEPRPVSLSIEYCVYLI